MSQQGQLIRLKRTGRDGEAVWAYRFRVGGRDSKRVQRGGFTSEQDAAEALERELERLRREQRVARSLTFSELVEAYLARHDVDPNDLRHTFATFALRAGISTFDLSRYMGASLTMIDRHYGHLA